MYCRVPAAERDAGTGRPTAASRAGIEHRCHPADSIECGAQFPADQLVRYARGDMPYVSLNNLEKFEESINP